MRIVFNTSFSDGLRSINRAAESMADAQRLLSSSKRIHMPSDDPLGASSAIGEHAVTDRLDAFTGASNAASYRLNLADSVLTDVISQLTAAQTTALAARGSERTQAERDAASGELLAIRDAIMADANTKFEGVYLFSGSQVTDAPFTIAGGVVSAYQGNGAPTTVEIGQGRSVANTFDGGRIFQGTDPQHVLTALADLAAAVQAGDDAGIASGVTALERAFDRATAAQSRVGNDLRTTDDVREHLSDLRLISTARLSRIEDANLAEASVRLAQAETAYRAALGAMATVGKLSLMDYIE